MKRQEMKLNFIAINFKTFTFITRLPFDWRQRRAYGSPRFKAWGRHRGRKRFLPGA